MGGKRVERGTEGAWLGWLEWLEKFFFFPMHRHGKQPFCHMGVKVGRDGGEGGREAGWVGGWMDG